MSWLVSCVCSKHLAFSLSSTSVFSLRSFECFWWIYKFLLLILRLYRMLQKFKLFYGNNFKRWQQKVQLFWNLRKFDICLPINKFYSQDFTEHEKQVLEMELLPYEHNIVRHSDFKSFSSIYELYQWLVRIRKSRAYQLIYWVVILILTLSVSTATIERSF